MNTKIVLFIIIFCTSLVNSQFKDVSSFSKNNIPDKSDTSDFNDDIIKKTNECDIFMKDRTSLYDVSILSLIDSTLKVEKGRNNNFLNIGNLNKIRFHKSSDFIPGALIGAGISFTYWAFVSFGAHDNEGKGWALLFGFLSTVPGALVGGLIGIASTPDDDLYDFSQGNPNAKMKRLRYIIEKHTPKMPFQK